MIEDGRTLNCSKTGIKMQEIPLKSHVKYNESGNGSCSLGLEHVELHFNITNVFEDNSDSERMSAEQYLEYDEADNTTDTDIDTNSVTDGDNNNNTHRAVGKSDKKSHGKSVNSPVYVIIA